MMHHFRIHKASTTFQHASYRAHLFINTDKHSYDASTDAFGNALGNSIVSAGRSTPQGKSIDEKLAESTAQFGQNVSNQTGQQVDKSINQSAVKTAAAAATQGAANLTVKVVAKQSKGDAAFEALVAARRDVSVRANNYIKGGRQRDAAIQSLITTTNQNRAIAASKRALDNQIRNERYRIGSDEVQAGFDSIGGTGFDAASRLPNPERIRITANPSPSFIPPQLEGMGRVPGVIYLTGHDALFLGTPTHLAIEYTNSDGSQTRWISSAPAEADGSFSLLEGFVKNQSDIGVINTDDYKPYNVYESLGLPRSRDYPSQNTTFGKVEPPIGISVDEYFQQLVDAQQYYAIPERVIDYDLLPSISDSYNSNSFVSGIIRATGGQPTISLNQFVGGDKPIPWWNFTNVKGGK